MIRHLFRRARFCSFRQSYPYSDASCHQWNNRLSQRRADQSFKNPAVSNTSTKTGAVNARARHHRSRPCRSHPVPPEAVAFQPQLAPVPLRQFCQFFFELKTKATDLTNHFFRLPVAKRGTNTNEIPASGRSPTCHLSSGSGRFCFRIFKAISSGPSFKLMRLYSDGSDLDIFCVPLRNDDAAGTRIIGSAMERSTPKSLLNFCAISRQLEICFGRHRPGRASPITKCRRPSAPDNRRGRSKHSRDFYRPFL